MQIECSPKVEYSKIMQHVIKCVRNDGRKNVKFRTSRTPFAIKACRQATRYKLNPWLTPSIWQCWTRYALMPSCWGSWNVEKSAVSIAIQRIFATQSHVDCILNNNIFCVGLLHDLGIHYALHHNLPRM